MCIHFHAQKTVKKHTPTPYLCPGVISRLQKMGQLRNALCQRPRPRPALLPIRMAPLRPLQTKLQVFVHTLAHKACTLSSFCYIYSVILLSVPDCVISTLLSEKMSPSRFGEFIVLLVQRDLYNRVWTRYSSRENDSLAPLQATG